MRIDPAILLGTHQTNLAQRAAGTREISSTAPEETDFLIKVRTETMQADRAGDPM